jgi:hypothetical protein
MLTLVCGGILDIECANPLDKALHSPFLEDTHQRRPQSLGSIRGDLGNCCLGTITLLDIAASDLLELEVPSNVCGHQDIGELARRHEKLGHEINVPVIETSILLPWLLSLLVVSVFLEQLDSLSVRTVAPVLSHEVSGSYSFEVHRCSFTVKESISLAREALWIASGAPRIGAMRNNKRHGRKRRDNSPSVVIISIDV